MPDVLNSARAFTVDHYLDRRPWAALAEAIRKFDADIVVLVARKMPRLVETLRLDLGAQATCISDQAIPFMHQDLRGARVAIVDDIWNVGTTMRHAAKRVNAANPRSVRLFALAAKDADAAHKAGVHLMLASSLTSDRYRALVDAVPKALRLSAKPYDMDFPVVPCTLRPPFNRWLDCWSWLQAKFGERVHCTVDEQQVAAGFARATVDVANECGWMVKSRLYFDFNSQVCNFVPMALAPSLPHKNTYPKDTLSEKIFASLERTLEAVDQDRLAVPVKDEDGFSRANTFCDALLFSDEIFGHLEGLLQRDSQVPFSVDDMSVQFGKAAVANCAEHFPTKARTASRAELQDYCKSRPQRLAFRSLMNEEMVVHRARDLLLEGLPTLALDALITDLGCLVGADDPSSYALKFPYSPDQIAQNQYLRLRLGFTYEDILAFFRRHLVHKWTEPRSTECVVSTLIDAFIDRGAIVPTFTLTEETSSRVYRKGEANPRWDEEINRLLFALDSLEEDDRRELIDRGRTRVAKITAIMALSASVPTSLGVIPLERGNAAMLPASVAERYGAELTKLVRQRGLWK